MQQNICTRFVSQRSAGNSSVRPNKQFLAPRCKGSLKILSSWWAIVIQNCWTWGKLHKLWKNEPTAYWHLVHIRSDMAGFILCLTPGVIHTHKILNLQIFKEVTTGDTKLVFDLLKWEDQATLNHVPNYFDASAAPISETSLKASGKAQDCLNAVATPFNLKNEKTSQYLVFLYLCMHQTLNTGPKQKI